MNVDCDRQRVSRYRAADGCEYYGSPSEDGQNARRWTTAPWLSTTAMMTETIDHAIQVLPPVVPPAIYCIGLNYAAHAAESGAPIPDHPVVFMKPSSAIVTDGDSVVLPSSSAKVDYEVELAVVIGPQPVRNVSRDDALSVVAGYVVANDISARDWQKDWGGGQWIRGKSFDSFCPIAAAVTVASAVADPQQLHLSCHVDGEQRQHGFSSDMIFSVAELIHFLSQDTTLLPGTLILTGTPPGVAMGMEAPLWLQAGQSVECTIAGEGVTLAPLQNT